MDERITSTDIGQEGMTGGPLKRVARYLGNDTFCLTFGDGLPNTEISTELELYGRYGNSLISALISPECFEVLNADANHQGSSSTKSPAMELGGLIEDSSFLSLPS